MKLVCEKDLRICSPGGAVHIYPAGVVFDVEDFWLAEAVKLGAKPVGGPADAPPVGYAPDPDRIAKIAEAIEALIEEGDPDNLTQAGQPRVSAVSGFVGFEVTREEVLAAFEQVAPGG